MITNIEMDHYGMIHEFRFNNISKINLIIGENSTGKTFLLKALYSAVRTMETHQRGDDITAFNDILADKLRWTFQTDRLGDLVDRDSDNPLNFRMTMDGHQVQYQFSRDAKNKIIKYSADKQTRDANSIFIPAKEVLSLFAVIQKSRNVDQAFGFDDTYLDLVNALSIAPSKGKNFVAFASARKQLNKLVDGKVEYDEKSGRWYYRNGKKQKFAIGATSEGVKKISILDRLLANGYLTRKSIIFIDEPESALHPKAIAQLMDMLISLANEMEIQIFISSHSYFVIRKLVLEAQQREMDISCVSLSKDKEAVISNLREGMPDNSIIDESIRLYQAEIDGVL